MFFLGTFTESRSSKLPFNKLLVMSPFQLETTIPNLTLVALGIRLQSILKDLVDINYSMFFPI